MKTYHFSLTTLICLIGTFLVLSCGSQSNDPEPDSSSNTADSAFQQALRAHVSDIKEDNYNAEQQWKEHEEEERIQQRELETKASLIGNWVYRGYLNGHLITSELSFTENTMEWYINGENAYRGRWDVSLDKKSQEWLILYNPVSSTNWNDVCSSMTTHCVSPMWHRIAN